MSSLINPPSGQLWYTTEGGDAATRVVRVTNHSTTQTIVVDNSPAVDPMPSSFMADIGLDTAAGFYFVALNGGPGGDHAFLMRGNIDGGSAPTTVIDFPDDIIV